MAPILEVADIVAGYGEAPILRGVSLRLESGELVAVIGPNGAGKSTLIKAIFGLLRPISGRVTYDGQDITGWAPERVVPMGMSYIPQVSNVFRTMTVRENLEMGAFILNFGGLASPLVGAYRVLNHRLPSLSTHRRATRYYSTDRLSRRDIVEKIDRVVQLFPDLKTRLGDRVGNLSGGQQQMVALARALMLKPKVLLIDEPSAGLAPILVDSVLQQIGVINRAGTAIVLVEQNARKALHLAHRGYILEAGKNRLEDRAEQLLQNPEIGELFLGGGARQDTPA